MFTNTIFKKKWQVKKTKITFIINQWQESIITNNISKASLTPYCQIVGLEGGSFLPKVHLSTTQTVSNTKVGPIIPMLMGLCKYGWCLHLSL